MAVLAALFEYGIGGNMPPDVIDDAGLHICESICMSEDFDHSRRSKAMTSHGHLVYREPIFPLRPINSIQASR